MFGDVILVGGVVFRHDGTVWVEEQRLGSSDDVALHGDVAVVGDKVFRYDGEIWAEEHTLPRSGKVATNGEVIVAGGTVLRHDGTSWIEERTLVAPDGFDADGFPSEVAISGNRVIAGAPYDDDNGTESGSAYVFELYPAPVFTSPEAEIDNAGSYVLRTDTATGETVRLNPGLIPARGDLFMGAEYTSVDDSAVNGVEYAYDVVDVERSGAETRHPAVRAVANPVDPPIKLIAPPYDARVTASRMASFDWSPRSRYDLVEISADPAFGDDSAIWTLRVPGTRQRTPRPGPAQLEALADMAREASGQLLYWRVQERSFGWQPNVSDTYRFHIDPGGGFVHSPHRCDEER